MTAPIKVILHFISNNNNNNNNNNDNNNNDNDNDNNNNNDDNNNLDIILISIYIYIYFSKIDSLHNFLHCFFQPAYGANHNLESWALAIYFEY